MPSVERAPVARHDRGPHARVPLVRDHLDPRVADAARLLRGAVPRRVVDDVDPVDEVRDAADRLDDEALLVVRGHDDCDPFAFDHQPEVALRRRRAANGSAASATIAPTSRPSSAPTSRDVRLERAVVFTAAAGSTTRLDSTLSARFRS